MFCPIIGYKSCPKLVISWMATIEDCVFLHFQIFPLQATQFFVDPICPLYVYSVYQSMYAVLLPYVTSTVCNIRSLHVFLMYTCPYIPHIQSNILKIFILLKKTKLLPSFRSGFFEHSAYSTTPNLGDHEPFCRGLPYLTKWLWFLRNHRLTLTHLHLRSGLLASQL